MSVSPGLTHADSAAKLLVAGPSALAVLDRRDQAPTERYQLRPHLQLVSGKIRDLCLGRAAKRNLAIIMPPQHGKSWLCSRYTPAWYLALFPARHVLLACYGADFARSWGRRAREVMTRWALVLGAAPAPEVAAAHHWETTAGGSMQTGGIGGSFSGKPGDLMIIDDPIKNAEEAASTAIQERNWEWYQSVWRSRRQPDTVSLIVATRWNERDLLARILAAEGDQWDVVHLSALAGADDPLGRQPGEALWPERMSRSKLERIAQISPWWFETMYQGHPSARDTGMFSGFTVVEPSDIGRIDLACRYWDLASTASSAGSDPDYTVGAKVGVTGTGEFVVLDVERFRLEPGPKLRRIASVAASDGPGVVQVMEQEPGSSGKDLIQHYAAAMPERAVVGVSSTGSKIDRAELTAAKSAAGALVIARASWNDAWIDEHRSFPGGAHDDMVDAGSGAVAWLSARYATREALASWAPDEQEIFAWR